jgi:hypothetical protein
VVAFPTLIQPIIDDTSQSTIVRQSHPLDDDTNDGTYNDTTEVDTSRAPYRDTATLYTFSGVYNERKPRLRPFSNADSV